MTTLLKRNPGLARFITCFVLLAVATGCTTMHPVNGSNATSYAAQIEAGDTVRITRNDMSTVAFKVAQLSDDGISGNNTFVAWSEIRQVDVKKIDAAKTGIAIAVSVLVVGLLVYLASDISIGPVFSPSGP